MTAGFMTAVCQVQVTSDWLAVDAGRTPVFCPRSGELRTQKLKVPPAENTELKGSLFKA